MFKMLYSAMMKYSDGGFRTVLELEIVSNTNLKLNKQYCVNYD